LRRPSGGTHSRIRWFLRGVQKSIGPLWPMHKRARGVPVKEEELTTQEGMFLVLPVPFRVLDGRVLVEAQAANGLGRWAENFSRIIAAAPIISENLIPKLSGFVWREFNSLEHSDRIVCRPLPSIYEPIAFLRSVPRIRRILGASINQSKYLQFALSGLFSGWGGSILTYCGCLTNQCFPRCGNMRPDTRTSFDYCGTIPRTTFR
jgi:hypothetical protein